MELYVCGGRGGDGRGGEGRGGEGLIKMTEVMVENCRFKTTKKDNEYRRNFYPPHQDYT